MAEQLCRTSGIIWDIVEQLCHRKYGIGADGLMLMNSHEQYDFEMIYYNADGNEGSMCGNGGRCLVQFAHDIGMVNSAGLPLWFAHHD
jgi:diaminopimelate epimerase